MVPTRLAQSFDFAPFGLSGVVYGTLLNHESARAAFAGRFESPPYKAAPKAPILYVKPRNTLLCSDGAVGIPANAAELEIGANLGLVIGRTACRVHRHDALDHVAGYLIMNDISVPHSEYYRPSIRYKARDGFCPLGPVSDRAAVADPDALHIRVYIDTALVQSTGTHELIRPAAQLLEAVTEFMTLSPGDVLGVGVAAPAPRVRAGQVATIEIDGLGSLTTSFFGAGA